MNEAVILWFTGLSGSGKSTLAEKSQSKLLQIGRKVKIIDGDEIRNNLNYSLGFSKSDIRKNNIYVAKVAKKYQNQYDYIFISLISPYKDHRQVAKEIIGENFYEIFINCPVNVCINRDVKGLYQQALSGKKNDMIGLSSNSPYEPPEYPDLILDTNELSIDEAIDKILMFLKSLS